MENLESINSSIYNIINKQKNLDKINNVYFDTNKFITNEELINLINDRYEFVWEYEWYKIEYKNNNYFFINQKINKKEIFLKDINIIEKIQSFILWKKTDFYYNTLWILEAALLYYPYTKTIFDEEDNLILDTDDIVDAMINYIKKDDDLKNFLHDYYLWKAENYLMDELITYSYDKQIDIQDIIKDKKYTEFKNKYDKLYTNILDEIDASAVLPEKWGYYDSEISKNFDNENEIDFVNSWCIVCEFLDTSTDVDYIENIFLNYVAIIYAKYNYNFGMPTTFLNKILNNMQDKKTAEKIIWKFINYDPDFKKYAEFYLISDWTEYVEDNA